MPQDRVPDGPVSFQDKVPDEPVNFFGMIFGCFLDEFWQILGSFFALSNGQQSCDLAIALGPKKEQKSKKNDHFGKENNRFFVDLCMLFALFFIWMFMSIRIML